MTAIQQTPVLLPPAAADRAAGVRLKVKDKRSSIKNRPEQSIYPTQKSVLRTEATPNPIALPPKESSTVKIDIDFSHWLMAGFYRSHAALSAADVVADVVNVYR